MKYVAWMMLALATGVYISGPIVDPDLWWHITVGRWIIGHGQIPEYEQWNMFALGEPWQAYSWSIEILLALADMVGDQGLMGLKFLLGCILALSLMYTLGRTSKDFFFGGILGVFAAASCFNHFTLRPQSFVWVYFAWLLFFCDEIDRKGLSRSRAAGVALCMCLWTNAQITHALGVAAVAGWLARPGEFRLAGKVTMIAILGTLLTPHFGGEWVTFFSKSDHPLGFSAIVEFGPATILMFTTSFLLIALAIFLAFAHLQPKKVHLFSTGYGAVLVGGALAVLKFLPFAIIMLCFLVARLWRDGRGERSAGFGNLGEAIERLRAGYLWVPKEGLSFLLLATAIVNGINVGRHPVSYEIIPVRAIDFIEEHKLKHPILHGFGRGGYVMYRFSDEQGVLEHKVVIDGRTNVNPPEIWKSFMKALGGKEGWQEILEKVEPGTILWRRASAFTELLRLHPDWCLMTYDGSEKHGYAVFVRQADAATYELPYTACTGAPEVESGKEQE